MQVFDFLPYTLRFFDRHCELAEDWEAVVFGRRWRIEVGMDTDGISWPQALMALLGDRFNPEVLPAAIWHDAMYRSAVVGRIYADVVFGVLVFYRIVALAGLRWCFWLCGKPSRWLLAPFIALRLAWRVLVCVAIVAALVAFGWIAWRGPRRWSASGAVTETTQHPKIGDLDG